MELLILFELLRKHRILFLCFAVGFFTVVVAGTFLIRPVYRAKAVILLNDSQSRTNLLSALKISPQQNIRQASEPFAKEILLATARPVADPVIDAFGLLDTNNERLTADDLTDESVLNNFLTGPFVSAELDDDADDILNILCTSPDKELAARISNAMAESYLRYRATLRQTDFQVAKDYVRHRLAAVRQEYLDGLTEVTAFQRDHGVIDLSYEAQGLITKAQGYVSAQRDNDSTLASLVAEDQAARKALAVVSTFRENETELRKSSSRNSLHDRLNELMLSLRAQQVELTDIHPSLVKLREQIAEAQQMLAQSSELTKESVRKSVDPLYDALKQRLAENSIAQHSAKAKRSVLAESLAQTMDKLMDIPLKTEGLSPISIKANALRDTYDALLRHQSQIAVAENTPMPDAVIIDPAVPPIKKHFPSKKISLTLGLFFAFLLGFAAVLLKEYLIVAAHERAAATQSGRE